MFSDLLKSKHSLLWYSRRRGLQNDWLTTPLQWRCTVKGPAYAVQQPNHIQKGKVLFAFAIRTSWQCVPDIKRQWVNIFNRFASLKACGFKLFISYKTACFSFIVIFNKLLARIYASLPFLLVVFWTSTWNRDLTLFFGPLFKWS